MQSKCIDVVFGRPSSSIRVGGNEFRATHFDTIAVRSNASEKDFVVRSPCAAQREIGRFCWLPVAGAVRKFKYIGIAFAYETICIDIRCVAHAANICLWQGCCRMFRINLHGRYKRFGTECRHVDRFHKWTGWHFRRFNCDQGVKWFIVCGIECRLPQTRHSHYTIECGRSAATAVHEFAIKLIFNLLICFSFRLGGRRRWLMDGIGSFPWPRQGCFRWISRLGRPFVDCGPGTDGSDGIAKNYRRFVERIVFHANDRGECGRHRWLSHHSLWIYRFRHRCDIIFQLKCYSLFSFLPFCSPCACV